MQLAQTIALYVLAYWVVGISLVAIVTVSSGNLHTVLANTRHGSKFQRVLLVATLPFTMVGAFIISLIFAEEE